MARSHKVYVVTGPFGILACFTVKHECLTYLEKFEPDYLKDLRVDSYPDGTRGVQGSILVWDGSTGQELWE